MDEKIKAMLAAVVSEASLSGRYESPWGLKGAKGGGVFLTPAMLASYLKVSSKTLERMRRNGEGPPFTKIGRRHIRYPVKALDEWVLSSLQLKEIIPD